MARIRTIKPDFFTSESIARIASYRARLTFIGLWTHVDDQGRCRDNPKLIKAAIWPLDDDVSIECVEHDLGYLARLGRLVRYAGVPANGTVAVPLLEVVNFHEHQKINHPSKNGRFPPPPADAGATGELREDSGSPTGAVSGDSANPQVKDLTGGLREDSGSPTGALPLGTREQGNGERGNREQGTPRERGAARAPRFDEFWTSYPRRVGKRKAEQAYAAAIKRGANPEHVITAARHYASATKHTEARFIAHPTSWLNAGRYDDEPDPTPAPEPSRSEQWLALARPTLDDVVDAEVVDTRKALER